VDVVGILTAGGDSPGLNAVIRGAVARALERKIDVVGVLNGWDGLMDGDTRPLDRNAVRGILQRGGTVLGTSRRDPYVHGQGWESVRGTLERNGIEGLIVIGGDGTLATALKLHEDGGLPVIGVPKTIDNDIPATDQTFGFDTAVQTATEAIDRLATTAEAHNRIMIVEVMGRTKGWIALWSGIAAGADAILIPEIPYDLDEVERTLRARHRHGKTYSIVVVAEGVEPPAEGPVERALDAFGFERLGGVGYAIGAELERRTGFETRVTVLGHLQRGGTPTAYDRVLATRFGVRAIEAVDEGRFGTMVALRGTDIVLADLGEAVSEPKLLDPALYDVAEVFFG
jgi:6-phosphofructokinase 1